jgi:uncharacterized membrane protein YfcA
MTHRRWTERHTPAPAAFAVIVAVIFAAGLVFGYNSEHPLWQTVLVGAAAAFVGAYALAKELDRP